MKTTDSGDVYGALRRLASRQPEPYVNSSEEDPLDKEKPGRYYRGMLPRGLIRCGIFFLAFAFLLGLQTFGSEADIKIPDLETVNFDVQGTTVNGMLLLYIGLFVCVLGMAFGWMQYVNTKKMEVHASMRAVSEIIWETCKTYLFQQGKFLMILWFLIAICITYYFKVLQAMPVGNVILILMASVLGILGSYGVAW